MSTTLNLLSDSTFADKIDAQNGILTDIRDSLGGGLDTSSLVYGDTPDADSVVQLKKKDPVTGNDVNVYPALAPASSLGRYLFPCLPSEIDWTNWNSPECFLSNSSSPTQTDIITPNNYKKSFYIYPYTANLMLYIRRDLIDPNFNLSVYTAIRNMFININIIVNSIASNNFPHIRALSLITVNNTEYFTFDVESLTANTPDKTPSISIII